MHSLSRGVAQRPSTVWRDDLLYAHGNWRFLMADPLALSTVLIRILGTKRPRVTQRVFAVLIREMRRDGTVPLSRIRIAAEAGVDDTSVSTALAELDKIGAVVRSRNEWGGLQVAINPRLATRLKAAERVQAQAEAPPIPTA